MVLDGILYGWLFLFIAIPTCWLWLWFCAKKDILVDLAIGVYIFMAVIVIGTFTLISFHDFKKDLAFEYIELVYSGDNLSVKEKIDRVENIKYSYSLDDFRMMIKEIKEKSND